MRFIARVLSVIVVAVGSFCAHAQGIGPSLPTPAGPPVDGVAIYVPAGPISSGQPVVAPPTLANPIPVTCANCQPSTPVGASSTPVNGTIAVTNTFQLLISQNNGRKGCVFQNQSTHTMYFSIAVTPTLGNSLQIPSNGLYTCSGNSNIVITDAIWVTGTATDAFAGNWQ